MSRDGATRRAVARSVLLLLAGCATPHAVTASRSAPVETAVHASSAPSTPRESRSVGTPLRFLRPRSCAEPRTVSGRTVSSCGVEDVLEVRRDADGRWVATAAGTAPARGPYPVELLRQWRRCGAPPGEELGAYPAIFTPYEDPDVSRCHLFREVDGFQDAVRGERFLEGLHPFVADCLRRLVAKARAEGIEVRVISGVRESTLRTLWVTKRDPRSGREVRTRTKRTVNRRTWHTWGLAVDVNLAHRRDLASAVYAFRDDAEERRQWMRVGEIGEALGLKWLGRSDDAEIFHFEWHPGFPSRPDPVQSRFARSRRAGGLPTVWQELRYDPSRGSAFSGLAGETASTPAAAP